MRESDLINFHATRGQILCGPYLTRLIAAAANRTGNFIRPHQLQGERAHRQTGSTRQRRRKVKNSGKGQRKVSKGMERRQRVREVGVGVKERVGVGEKIGVEVEA